VTHWYTLFAIAVLLLWAGATPQDRHAATVILVATLASWLIVDYGTAGIVRPWKLVVPGAVETATIMALLNGRFTRTACFQAVLVLLAWWCHLLCFADLQLGTDMVYTHYEGCLAAVAAAQILAFHDTYIHHFRRLGRWWADLGAGGGNPVRSPGLSAGVLRDSRPDSRLSPQE
jgi:hypothetical protein